MERTKELAIRFREVIFHGTWIANTNYQDQIKDISWHFAVHQIGKLNSIAALVQHIHYYIQGLNKVFAGGDLTIKDKFSFDFPPIQSQSDWDNILNAFWKNADEFACHLEELEEADLKHDFVDAKYGTIQRNIDAMIEHCYYHLGQIVLLKKMVPKEANFL